MKYYLPALFLLWSLPLYAVQKTDRSCEAQKPVIAGYETIHGIVDSQMEIDPSAPGRLRPRQGSRLIEIERLWGLGSKTIRLEKLVDKSYVYSIHWSLFLKSDRIEGVKIWSAQVSGQDLRDFDFPLLLEREGVDEWKHLDFNLERPQAVNSDFRFDFYARTIFKNPWSPINVATGTRVDACVYFLVR